MARPPPKSPLPPTAPLSRSRRRNRRYIDTARQASTLRECRNAAEPAFDPERSEEHTSELQSRSDLVCRLLLEKKNPAPPHSTPLSAFSSALFPVRAGQRFSE